MAIISNGTVATPAARRYVQQLVKHWSHKLAITESEGVVTIPFSPDITLTLAANDAGIVMRLVTPTDDEDLRFRKVFENHLDRFAFREVPLTYAWAR